MKIATTAVVLDLDDTLYLERDYVRSGFDAVGRQVSEQFGVDDFGSRCWTMFEQGVRGSTFDRVAADAGLDGELSTRDLVETYRSHDPSIRLCDDAARFLEDWPSDRPLALITDGPVPSQSAKISALRLDERCFPIVMTDSFGVEFRKPHERAFELVERALGLPPDQLTYIADNPRKDFIAPRRRRWHTIRIRRALGEHAGRDDPNDCAADNEIRNFGDLTW